MQDLDLVIRGGTVATACDTFAADVGVAAGRIVALGKGLARGAREIDAGGRLVLPGGVDSHCHIAQLSSFGVMNADDFESAHTAAAFGGTTTTISFAAQYPGQSVRAVVAAYREEARKAILDHAFHIIVSDPRPEVLSEELPALIREGCSSLKLFMTYDHLRVTDEQMLDVLALARRHGAMVCVHAENHGMMHWMADRLLERGHTAPRYHAVYHARAAEAEAINRVIAMAALLDQPVTIFHVSTAAGMETIRRAQGEGLKVYGETCPQYLLLDARDLDKPGLEGAKWMFSPPPRDAGDREALWRGLAYGTFQLLSSDHAPYRFDESGKLSRGPDPTFREIANGIPGLELRLPLLFSEGVRKGRIGLNRFVELGCTNGARIYGLHPQKGTIAIGSDADIAIWDPEKRVEVTDDLTHDRTGYCPYAGMTIEGWPVVVLSRGEVVVEDGRLRGTPGRGRFLPRAAGEAARPSGRLQPEMDPATNFGARLLE
jgi:dihydropyrimidinase